MSTGNPDFDLFRISEDHEALRDAVRAVSEDLTRAELAQLTLADRFRGAEGHRLTLHLGATLRVSGTVQEVGSDWVVLAEAGGGAARWSRCPGSP